MAISRRTRQALTSWLLIVAIGVASVILVLNLQSSNTFSQRASHARKLLQDDRLSTDQQSSSSHFSKFDRKMYDPKLEVTERHKHTFDWNGFTYNEYGWRKEIVSKVTTSLVHSFSPAVEKEAAKKFVDPRHENIFFGNAPAVKWHNGSLILVCRIWLDKERYEIQKLPQPYNSFQDNYLFTQTFDKYLNPTSIGRMLFIGLNKESDVGDGAIEPRLHRVQGRLFSTFNAAIMMPWGQKIDWTMIYDYDRDTTYVPDITDGSPAVTETKRGVPRDKHWMALVQNDELYFVNNLDPLGVMKCTLNGTCHFVQKESQPNGFIYSKRTYVGRLRGGTPFEHYSGDYYIGIAHYTSVKQVKHIRYYSCHLILLCVNPYRIVFVSNDILFHKDVYKDIPQVRGFAIEDNFLFPVSLLVESADSIVIGGHLNDHSAVLLRLTGLEAMLRTVIEEDQLDKPKHGPPVEYVRRHVREVLQDSTKIAFLL